MTSLALVSTSSGEIKEPNDLTPRELWQMEIEQSEKELKTFHRRGDEANRQFVDERSSITADQNFFNIYYANTNILESALYSQVPKPSVSRRYQDYQDNTARVAALILERSLQQDLNDPEDQFDAVMRQAVQDRLIPGMGVAWLRLETETELIPTSEGGTLTNDAQGSQPHSDHPYDGFTVPPASEDPNGLPVPLRRITEQRVAVDYVHWRDFRYSPCRIWSERRWVGRKVYMTYDQLKDRFGKAKADLTSLDHSVFGKDGDHTPDDSQAMALGKEVFQKATVYEIWDRTTRKVHWYAPGYPKDLLDTRSDFLKLQSFEPVPQPMFANISTSNTVPRPDYYMIQDQYAELNTVNARISLLVQACKVVGIYDQSAKGLSALFTGNENTMVPVPDWGQFSEKGGVKGAVDWIPLEMVVAALQRLYEAREAIKGQIYELTGIADIVRGDSKASETLGAQQIKAQFASIRIKKLQNEVARFASEILRIKAEIQVKHFTPDTLIRRSGITYTDNDQFVPSAITLLKSEAGFKWRVEVQADSMAQADYDAEKKDRIEFMSAITGYMTQALPIAGQIPELKPVILGILKWGVSAFKGASDIEGMIDKQLSLLEGKPPPPPQPDPKVQATQMKGQLDQQKAQLDAKSKQQDMQIKQQTSQMDLAAKEKELEMEQRKMEMEMQQMQLELQFKERELGMKAQEHQQNMQAKQQATQLDLQSTIEKNQVDSQTHQQIAQQKVQDAMVQSDLNKQKGEQALDQAQATHEQGLQQTKESAAQDIKIAAQTAAAKAKSLPRSNK